MNSRKPIPGMSGYYEADTDGNIYSVARAVPRQKGGFYRTQERILKQKNTSAGYLAVHLRPPGGETMMLSHRAILSAFVPQPENAPFVNHLNGDKKDNRLANLEWCTNSENMVHAFRVLGAIRGGKGRTGAAHHRSTPVIGTCVKTGSEVRFEALMDAQRAGFRASEICMCTGGKQKTHYGYTWRKSEANQ